MTDLEFQTVTDLERVREIRAKIDQLDASVNIGTVIKDEDFTAMRRKAREWEQSLTAAVKVRSAPKQVALTEAKS